MKPLRKSCRGSAGIGIVELLVAMAVSLVLLGGIYVTFVGSTRTNAYTDQLSRMQENARFAMHMLRQRVLGAGYMGCAQDAGAFTNTLNDPSAFSYNFGQTIYGLEAAGSVWSDSSGQVSPTTALSLTSPLAGNDIVVVREVSDDLELVTIERQTNNSADLKITPGTTGFVDGDILMVSDCQYTTVFQVTNYTASNGNVVHNAGTATIPPGNSTMDLGHSFAEGSQIVRPQRVAFYLASNPAGNPSLYRRVNQSTPEELVENVELMQVLYGVDSDGDLDVDQYATAADVNDWAEVVAVRIGLLVRSEVIPGLEAPSATGYDVDGDGTSDFTDPGDQRLRLVVSGTMGLRNRLR